MKTRYLAILAVPILLLAGCAATGQLPPAAAPPATSPSQSPAPSTAPVAATAPATPAPSATPAGPIQVNAADYLVSGKPHHPDSNGEWYGRWAFYADARKSVFCDIFVFSGDPAAVHCYLTSHALDAQVSWTAPASITSSCGGQGSYSVALNIESLYPKQAGFMGCDPFIDAATASIQAKTKVLPDQGILAVSPFSCTTDSGTVTCRSTASAGGGGKLSFGLQSVAFAQ